MSRKYRLHTYGSINLLGYGRSEESMMRLESANIVPALKERISTQIQVIPETGGRSSLSGPGCGRV